ncbi:hypothetical protein JKP88DRAFT_288388 [Tribonema minus]|uniref:Uncharacterized protein n=1 Tax=Tribonema minus TaxID=303371 RepID=A0A836CHS1_9STRA|nr:hypothetical protein JKP88DRAFT_288388 [Tribonema minus]
MVFDRLYTAIHQIPHMPQKHDGGKLHVGEHMPAMLPLLDYSKTNAMLSTTGELMRMWESTRPSDGTGGGGGGGGQARKATKTQRRGLPANCPATNAGSSSTTSTTGPSPAPTTPAHTSGGNSCSGMYCQETAPDREVGGLAPLGGLAAATYAGEERSEGSSGGDGEHMEQQQAVAMTSGG